MFRLAIAATIAVFAITALDNAKAQTAQPHTIVLVVPFPVGGPTDTIGRIVADGLQSTLGQTVIVENVPGAFRAWAMPRPLDRLRHEHPVMPALANRHPLKRIISGMTHKNPKIVARQKGAIDNIVVEIQIQRNSCAQVVVQIQVREMGILREITGQPVELIIESRVITHHQSPCFRRRNQSARAASATNHPLHGHSIHIPNIDAVII